MENKVDKIIDIISLLNHETDFDEMLRLISVKTLELFECDFVKISVFNPITQFTIKTVFKNQKDFNSSCLHLINTNISGWLIKNASVFCSNDLTNDERFIKGLLQDCGIRSALGALLYASNKPIGIILLLNEINSTRKFNEEDISLVQKLASAISPFVYRIEKIHQYFSPGLSENDLINKYSKFGLIGKSAHFIQLLRSIDSAAKCDVKVLLEGETGTGKELIAKAIHKASQIADKKFVVVDCTAIPDNLIESELFGHTKGAFTGATKEKPGLIEEADGGTLFIDEINLLQRDMQVKLLRFLQEKEFRPIGSNQVKKSNVRIIAATSVSLEKLVREQKMREELFYRLNVYPIHIPSLNERFEDIMLLAHHFIRKFAAQQNKIVETVDSEIMEYLIHRNWSGNIRELENFIERIVTIAPSDEKIIFQNTMPAEYLYEMLNLKRQNLFSGGQISLTEKITEIETHLIRETLVNFNWNQSKAANALNIPEQTLRYKMHKLNITKPEF
jgi:transcriptional regulator with PAS, ATPase and Fis domain